jgi:hypothetical protein
MKDKKQISFAVNVCSGIPPSGKCMRHSNGQRVKCFVFFLKGKSALTNSLHIPFSVYSLHINYADLLMPAEASLISPAKIGLDPSLL